MHVIPTCVCNCELSIFYMCDHSTDLITEQKVKVNRQNTYMLSINCCNISLVPTNSLVDTHVAIMHNHMYAIRDVVPIVRWLSEKSVTKRTKVLKFYMSFI